MKSARNFGAGKRIAGCGLLAWLWVFQGAVFAQERKAYKVVDKDGNVTYSQTPPVDGKDAKKVNIAPAQQGRGGYTGGYSPRENYRYSERHSLPPPPAASVIPLQAPQSPQEQRMAAVKAECERNRGADCNNPSTLQYLDSTSIPRRGRY